MTDGLPPRDVASVGMPSFGKMQKRSKSGLFIVISLHLALFWALASGLAQRMVDVVKQPIQTRLLNEDRPEPPPPPPALPPPPNMLPPVVVQVPVPTVIPLVTPPPAPAITAPPPAPPPPVAPPPPAPDAIRAEAPPAPAAPSARARNPDDAYFGELRGYLLSIRRYPTSREARQLRPQGTVRIWIELDRAGTLLNTGIESTSGSLLIDNEALRTVRNGRFPPFAADAFVGQTSHRFVIPIEYLPGG